MNIETEFVFTKAQYDQLNVVQREAIEAVAEYLSGQTLSEGTDMSTVEIAARFNLLKASHGCVPPEEGGEELNQTIRRKFGALFQVGMDLAEAELPKRGKQERKDYNFCLVMDPCFDDATHLAIV